MPQVSVSQQLSGSGPRGSSGARRRGRLATMATHGKLRRERGPQAEYETQIKGEGVLGVPGALAPRLAPSSLPSPSCLPRSPHSRCISPHLKGLECWAWGWVHGTEFQVGRL